MSVINYDSIARDSVKQFLRATAKLKLGETVTLFGVDWTFVDYHFPYNLSYISIYFTSCLGTVRISDHWSKGSKVNNVGLLGKSIFSELKCREGKIDEPVDIRLSGFMYKVQGGVRKGQYHGKVRNDEYYIRRESLNIFWYERRSWIQLFYYSTVGKN